MVAQTVALPNVRKFFIPDPDHYIIECDLDRADAQVVAWEANDDKLKEIFRTGADLHTSNGIDIFGADVCDWSDDKDAYKWRHAAKQGVHATNYGVRAKTLGKTLTQNIGERYTTARAQSFIDSWFKAHPGIKDWHERIEMQLQTTRTVYNKFGYRRVYLDRIDNLLKEALAWIPQSTVALTINKGLINVDEQLSPEVEVLLQVHDSLIMQFHKSLYPEILPKIKECLTITIPYDDPLVIPVSCAASLSSWGECVDVDWITGEPKK